jgi:2-hydroxychromene-2-carboxylate isomerase
MDTPRVEFLFDFGSPNAYLVHRVLPAFAARTGATVDYVPVLLGGLFKLANNRSPIVAFAEIPNKLAYKRLEMERFVAKHGLDRFRMNPHFPVNTLKIMRGAVAARGLGVFERYVEAVFAAMWERGLDMDDAATMAAVLGEAGLDAAALMEAAQTPEVKAALVAHTEAAHARGAFGAPTFFVDGAIWFGKERLRDVEEALAARARTGA